MARKKKYSYYVGFFAPEGKIRYVTKIERSSKSFWYTAGERAMEFSKADADDLNFGLVVNGYPAVVVRTPEWMYPINPAEGETKSWGCKENGED